MILACTIRVLLETRCGTHDCGGFEFRGNEPFDALQQAFASLLRDAHLGDVAVLQQNLLLKHLNPAFCCLHRDGLSLCV
jgi:hypothetical protein